MTKNWRKISGNILLFPVVLLLLTAAIESVAFLGGFILLGIIKFDDIQQLFSSPIFHGLALLIALSLFVPWKKIGQKLGT